MKRSLRLSLLLGSLPFASVLVFPSESLGQVANPGAAQTSTQRPGQFGGAGVTGQSLVNYNTLNVSSGFSSGSSAFGGGSGTGSAMGSGIGGLGGQTGIGGGAGAGIGGLGQTGGQTGSPFGPNAFGGTGNTGFGGGLGGIGGAGGIGGIGGVGGLGGLGGGLGLGGIGGLGGLGGNRNRMNTGATNTNQKNKVRATVRPDIAVTRPTPSSIAVSVDKRMTQIPLPTKLRNVNAAVEGGEVVLRGIVATESDKKMAERLLKLEPGVNSVRNELVVQSSSAEQIQASSTR